MGVLIIPKWQINDSWFIAILFRTCLYRPKNQLNMDPRSPYLSLKYFNNYKNNIGTSLNILNYHIWESENLHIWDFLKALGTVSRFVRACFFACSEFWVSSFYMNLWRWGSDNHTNCINKISKFLDMNSISIKKHEIDILVNPTDFSIPE